MIAARSDQPFAPFTPPPNPRCGTCGRPIRRPHGRGWEHVSTAVTGSVTGTGHIDHYAWLERS